MSEQVDNSIMARLLGQNWRTTLGGTLSAAGGVLATQTTGKWQIAGGIMLAIGLQWMGATARDKTVTAAQMEAAGNGQPIPTIKPPTVMLAALLWIGIMAGCMAPVTVNVLSSRMVTTYGTNTVSQSIEGGANLSSNTTTATIPLK